MGVLPETLKVFYKILKQSTPSHWTSKSLTYLLGSLRNWPRIKRLIKRRLGVFGWFFCFHRLYNVFYIFNRIYLCPEFFWYIFKKRNFCILLLYRSKYNLAWNNFLGDWQAAERRKHLTASGWIPCKQCWFKDSVMPCGLLFPSKESQKKLASC